MDCWLGLEGGRPSAGLAPYTIGQPAAAPLPSRWRRRSRAGSAWGRHRGALPPLPSAQQAAARCGLLTALLLHPCAASAGWLRRLPRAGCRGCRGCCQAWDARCAHPPVHGSAPAPGLPQALSIVDLLPGALAARPKPPTSVLSKITPQKGNCDLGLRKVGLGGQEDNANYTHMAGWLREIIQKIQTQLLQSAAPITLHPPQAGAPAPQRARARWARARPRRRRGGRSAPPARCSAQRRPAS